MSALKPSRLNKLLGGLFCMSLWRKGALCCSMNCSCFNDVENAEAERHRAQEAKWKYRTEKMAAKRDRREKKAERRRSSNNTSRQAEQARPNSTLASSSAKVEHGKREEKVAHMDELSSPSAGDKSAPSQAGNNPAAAAQSLAPASEPVSAPREGREGRGQRRKQEKEEARAEKRKAKREAKEGKRTRRGEK